MNSDLLENDGREICRLSIDALASGADAILKLKFVSLAFKAGGTDKGACLLMDKTAKFRGLLITGLAIALAAGFCEAPSYADEKSCGDSSIQEASPIKGAGEVVGKTSKNVEERHDTSILFEIGLISGILLTLLYGKLRALLEDKRTIELRQIRYKQEEIIRLLGGGRV